MKDAYNYSGFSSTLVMIRRRRSDTNKQTVVIDSAEREALELKRSVPPYLVQPAKGTSGFKL